MLRIQEKDNNFAKGLFGPELITQRNEATIIKNNKPNKQKIIVNQIKQTIVSENSSIQSSETSLVPASAFSSGVSTSCSSDISSITSTHETQEDVKQIEGLSQNTYWKRSALLILIY